ncbi:sugar phosphate isomerase/epimerase [Candidatus Woesearchaeota archaeon]|nr:sugar phosphate isomerase/epimerase [Candidatus Woesearchaeota archaeon]
MDFGNDYWHALDKKAEDEFGLDMSAKDIGLSSGIGDPWKNVRSHITAGASHVELGFMGTGKGSIAQVTSVTPETISKEKREDIRQMAKLNDVTLSTHASANVMGFAGLREGRFSDQAAQQAVSEVKRAVEFAADTAEGGPVVIHLGEFPREIKEKSGGKFEMYPTEEEKGQVGLVDKQTGEIIASFTKDIKVSRVVTKKDEYGNDVPVVDEKGKYKYEEWGYKQFIDEAKKEGKNAGKLFYDSYLQKEILNMSAEERRWFSTAEKARKEYLHLEEMKKDIEETRKKNPLGAKRIALQLAEQSGVAPRPGTPEYREFLEHPEKVLDEAIEAHKREVKYLEDASVSYGQRRVDLEKKKGNIVTLEEYGIGKSTENIARAAMYAYDVEKKKKLKNPLFISPENIFPEMYGSFPEEMREIIKKSRQAMTKMLIEKKSMDEEEAKKVAANHIKATFDIGHANTWRKYFKGSDKDFKKWLLKEVDKLNEDGFIGNVHLSDNFGYEDEHLTPGQGNAPIEDFIKKLREKGFKQPMVVEPGAQGEGEDIYGAMTGAWARIAASPMYRVDGVSQSWSDIGSSYFGRTGSPTYIVGAYAPSKDWQFWSETPIE